MSSDLAPSNGDAESKTPDPAAATVLDEEQRRADAAYGLMAVLDAAPIAVAILDTDGRVGFFNARLAEMLDGQERDITGKAIHRFYVRPAEGAELVVRANEGSVVRDQPVALKRADGTTVWALTSLQRTEFGGRDSILAWFYDITAQKALETRLRQSEESLLDILEASPLGVTILDGHGQVMFWNNRLLDDLGYQGASFAEAAARSFYRYERDREKLLQQFQADGRVRNAEVRLTASDGGEAWGLVTMEPLFFEGKQGLLTWIYNITERKLTEQVLNENVRQLRSILDASPVPIVITRLADDRVVYVNEPLARLIRTPLPEIIGGHAVDYIMNPKRRLRFMEQIQERESVRDFDTEIVNADGETVWVQMSGVLIEYDGESSLFMALHDVTERVDQEQALSRAKDEAESIAEAKSNFLATMSHEIRTPMNGVITMAELLEKTPLNSEQQEMAAVIRDSAGSLLTIINDILDFSKIDAGKLDLETVSLSLSDLVEGVGDLVAIRASEKGLTLACHIDPTLPDHLLGDPVRLRQILVNLAGNAVKFTERGAVRIDVSRAGGDKSSGSPGGRIPLIFRVTDTGIGMSKAQQERLFQPFNQADASTARRFGGTGLGLSISRSLIELMGGEIGCYSEPGEGSTFWFKVSLQVRAERRMEDGDGDYQDVSILLVSDSTVTVDTLSTYLNYWGMRPTVCQNAAQALVEIEQRIDLPNPVQVVLIDNTRSDTTNLHRYSALIEAARANDAQSVLLSPMASISTLREAANEQGFIATITKPVHRSALWRTIGAALGRFAIDDDRTAIKRSTKGEFRAPARLTAREGYALILVAEDNSTNRLVLDKILSQLGFAADMVADGRQALVALESGDYSLLLTDCHMPEVDGYELARQVRLDEIGTTRHLPVIALTADALVGTEQKCAEAGMDGYLTKPVDIAAMEQVVGRFLPKALELRKPAQADVDAPPLRPAPAAVLAEGGGPGTQADGQPPPALDLGPLTEVFGEVNDDLKEMLVHFVEATEDLIDALEAAIVAEDWKAANESAHAAKGAAQYAGATKLAQLCEQVELGLRADNPGPARLAAGKILHAFNEVRAEISAL